MNLARMLADAERAFLDAEHIVERVLDSIYPDGWSDFEAGRDISVFGCIPSEAALDTLLRCGFDAVLQHPHEAREFSKCSCRARRASQ